VLAFLLTVTPALYAQDREGVMGDLIHDVTTVETKVLGLAKTMPPMVYDWRPAKGVRSTAEVLVHIAGDNYFLPALLESWSGPRIRCPNAGAGIQLAGEGKTSGEIAKMMRLFDETCAIICPISKLNAGNRVGGVPPGAGCGLA
jgi:hypothetical protein